MEFAKITGMPQELKEKIGHLKYSSVQTAYFPDNLDTEAQWVYYRIRNCLIIEFWCVIISVMEAKDIGRNVTVQEWTKQQKVPFNI